jgi:hypothetical protein
MNWQLFFFKLWYQKIKILCWHNNNITTKVIWTEIIVSTDGRWRVTYIMVRTS